MDCNQANDAMTLYMEKRLKHYKKPALWKHIRTCEDCRAHFLAFDTMMEAYHADAAPFEHATAAVPDSFVASVMASVKALPPYHAEPAKPAKPAVAVDTRWDNGLRIMLGAFTVLIGVGFILAHWDYPQIAVITKIFDGLAAFFDAFVAQLADMLQAMGLFANTSVAGTLQYALAAVAGLGTAFFMIFRRERLHI